MKPMNAAAMAASAFNWPLVKLPLAVATFSILCSFRIRSGGALDKTSTCRMSPVGCREHLDRGLRWNGAANARSTSGGFPCPKSSRAYHICPLPASTFSSSAPFGSMYILGGRRGPFRKLTIFYNKTVNSQNLIHNLVW